MASRRWLAYLTMAVLLMAQFSVAQAQVTLPGPVEHCEGSHAPTTAGSPEASDCCPAENPHLCCILTCAVAPAAIGESTTMVGSGGHGSLAFPEPTGLTGRVVPPLTRPPIPCRPACCPDPAVAVATAACAHLHWEVRA